MWEIRNYFVFISNMKWLEEAIILAYVYKPISVSVDVILYVCISDFLVFHTFILSFSNNKTLGVTVG